MTQWGLPTSLPIDGGTNKVAPIWIRFFNDLSAAVSSSNDVYDIGVYYGGKPMSNMVMLRFTFPRSVNFVANFAGSRGFCNTAPTNYGNFMISQINTTGYTINIGMMQFSPSTNIANFNTVAVNFVAGDKLIVRNSYPKDSSMNQISFTLTGSR